MVLICRSSTQTQSPSLSILHTSYLNQRIEHGQLVREMVIVGLSLGHLLPQTRQLIVQCLVVVFQVDDLPILGSQNLQHVVVCQVTAVQADAASSTEYSYTVL